MNQLEDRILSALHIYENFEDLALFDKDRILSDMTVYVSKDCIYIF